jgi:heme A synthase
MFATFLIGTVLVTSIVMLFLLALPSDASNRRARDAVPLIGAGALALAILVAAVTGVAISG